MARILDQMTDFIQAILESYRLSTIDLDGTILGGDEMSVKEQDIVKIIANSGESQMKAFEALKCIKTKEFRRHVNC